ncbi:hypothetical protein LX32DRAFT_351036 [Colletotrichum zoysiae]|uniref:Uncharacterized protein n=1 Tax=Colletotrichum zoysiae TaxID=1216348 RepID=A0AAD9HKF3_9PEZI|nr:hypothetical protein LX32DRAFT_351036 [Colletotrichum zoysiae]
MHACLQASNPPRLQIQSRRISPLAHSPKPHPRRQITECHVLVSQSAILLGQWPICFALLTRAAISGPGLVFFHRC